jgi:hypothetical protein
MPSWASKTISLTPRRPRLRSLRKNSSRRPFRPSPGPDRRPSRSRRRGYRLPGSPRQRPLGRPARLEELGKNEPFRPCPRLPVPVAIAIALGQPVGRALAMRRADPHPDLHLHQLKQHRFRAYPSASRNGCAIKRAGAAPKEVRGSNPLSAAMTAVVRAGPVRVDRLNFWRWRAVYPPPISPRDICRAPWSTRPICASLRSGADISPAVRRLKTTDRLRKQHLRQPKHRLREKDREGDRCEEDHVDRQ